MDDTFPAGSGLNSTASDVVGRITVLPSSWFSFTARGRFDHRHVEGEQTDAHPGPLQAIVLDRLRLREFAQSRAIPVAGITVAKPSLA